MHRMGGLDSWDIEENLIETKCQTSPLSGDTLNVANNITNSSFALSTELTVRVISYPNMEKLLYYTDCIALAADNQNNIIRDDGPVPRVDNQIGGVIPPNIPIWRDSLLNSINLTTLRLVHQSRLVFILRLI